MLESVSVKTATIDCAGFHIVVCFQSIFTIVEEPCDLLDVDVVFVPVGIVSFEYDCIVSCCVCNSVRSAVSDVIFGFTVCVIFSVCFIVSTEFTAFGNVVFSAHRSEYAVTKHCHEVCSIMCKCVNECFVVNSFNTNFAKVCNVTIDIFSCVNDETLNEVFETAASVHHVLHTSYEVVSFNVCNCFALRCNPFDTLTDLECVCYCTVFVNSFLVACSESGLQYVFRIVFIESVICVYECFRVSSFGYCENVPVLRVGRVTECVSVFDCVTFFSEESFYEIFVCACTFKFSPFCFHFVSVLNCDRFCSYDNVVISIAVVTPKSACSCVRSYSGDSVVTAVCGRGKQYAGFEKFCFCDSHESKSFGYSFCCFCCVIGCQKVA